MNHAEYRSKRPLNFSTFFSQVCIFAETGAGCTVTLQKLNDLKLRFMNFTLTPGVYAALNLLSKSARSKVLEAAFAFVICGVRPANLSKNLLVMFMMVVDSASEGKLTYVPDAPAEEEKKVEEPVQASVEQPYEPEPLKATQEAGQTEEKNYTFHITGGNRIVSDKEKSSLPGVKKVKSRPSKKCRHAAR